MKLYDLIMSSPTISYDTKIKLVKLIEEKKISDDKLNQIIWLLSETKYEMDNALYNYVKSLDSLYAKHVEKDVKNLIKKEKLVEIKYEEINNKIKGWDFGNILSQI